MKDKVTNEMGELLLNEFVNVAESCTVKSPWNKRWGEIVEDVLYLYPSNKPNTQALHKVKVRGLEIHPAAKETGRILAFKLVNKGKCVIVLEPLNIQDMGRWISSLFAAIQGFYISNNLLIIETTKSKGDNKSFPVSKSFPEKGFSDEMSGMLVNVRSLAQKFEQMAVPEVELRPPRETVRRSKSTPNLAENNNIIILSSNGTANGQQQKTETNLRRHMNEAKMGTTSRHVQSYKGPYMEQDDEKGILDTATNPFLAKRKLVKQEQQIQRLEATVKSIAERIARQKKTLAETQFAIQELRSTATDSQDEKDLAALEEQSVNLQKQISQSEASIQDYNQTIHQLETDMVNLSKFINWDKHAEVSAEQRNERKVLSSAAVEAAPRSPAAKENGSNSEVASAATEASSEVISSDEEEEELEIGAPAWAREAQRKSRAFKKLEKQGMLK